jgi:SAM-dependent methyltransferase
VSDAIKFDPDLYRGTADYYDRFRLPYHREMLDQLIGCTRPSGHGRLLDLACGTGQITFALAEHFAEAWAVDQEPGMIEKVCAKAASVRAPRLHAVVSPAEVLDAPAGSFELVAIGNAFHRLRRDAVATRAFSWLQPGRCIALLWSSVPWGGERDWQRALSELLTSWQKRTGVEHRIPAGWDEPRRERPDLAVLAAAGFEPIGSARFPTGHRWMIEELIGLIYSTSFLPRAVLGDHAPAFELDLRRELGRFASADGLADAADFAYELARRPPLDRR